MKNKILLTIIVLFLTCSGLLVIDATKGAIESQVAVGQLADDTLIYSFSRAIAHYDIIRRSFIGLVSVFFIGIWLPVLFIRRER